MAEYQSLHDAHGELVDAVKEATKPGFSPIPISIISMNNTLDGQMIIFDGTVAKPSTVVARLRAAADYLENAS